jgi:hypothetical protein
MGSSSCSSPFCHISFVFASRLALTRVQLSVDLGKLQPTSSLPHSAALVDVQLDSAPLTRSRSLSGSSRRRTRSSSDYILAAR